jgi:hypothetical protein
VGSRCRETRRRPVRLTGENAVGRCVLVREPGSTKTYDVAFFTLDEAATAAQAVERYAVRWSIEPANALGEQQMGVWQARNRMKNASERTVPFGMLTQSMVILWYAMRTVITLMMCWPAGWTSRGTEQDRTIL